MLNSSIPATGCSIVMHPGQDSESRSSVPPCPEGVGGSQAGARPGRARHSVGGRQPRGIAGAGVAGGEGSLRHLSSRSPVMPRSPRVFPGTVWAFPPPDSGARTLPARSWGSRTVTGRGGVAVFAPFPNLRLGTPSGLTRRLIATDCTAASVPATEGRAQGRAGIRGERHFRSAALPPQVKGAVSF